MSIAARQSALEKGDCPLEDWGTVPFFQIFACTALLFTSSGCGSQQQTLPSADQQADAKVAAIKQLADAMAQDANGEEARGALENFRNTPFDPRKNPKQAEEIRDVYRQRIQGKYRGFVAQEIQAEIGTLPGRGK